MADAGAPEAKGLAGSGGKDGKKDAADNEDAKEKKGGGFMGKLSSPFGSGEKQERAEVTGTGAGRGVGGETKEKEAPPVEKVEEPEQKKKGGGFLGKLSNPFGSGEKEERAEVTGTGAGRGVGGETKEKDAAPVQKVDEPKEEKKGGGFLGKLSNPFGSGEKEERAEVTGTGAGRGVGSEGEGQKEGERVRTAALVAVNVTPAELAAFKKEGKLR